MDGESGYTRRGLLRATGGATVAVAVASAAGTAAAQTDFGGWLSGVGNYDGTVVDATGQASVTVEVGVQANGGAFGFGPAAVQVDPGTTVTWEWTGEGGQHSVVDNAGGFESELVGEEGVTYEQSFDAEGVVKYYCATNRDDGMKGVVVVGGLPGAGGSDGTEASGGNESGSGEGGEGGGGEDSGTANSANQTALRTMVAMLVLGILSPLLFLLLLRWRQEDDSDQPKRYPR
jgi:halocyanin-like protein